MKGERTYRNNINPTEIIYSGLMILRNGSEAIKVKGTITNLFSYTYRIKFEGKIIEPNNYSLRHLLGEYDVEAESFNGKVYIYKSKGEKLVGQVIKELTTKMVEMDELNLELVNLREIGSKLSTKQRL